MKKIKKILAISLCSFLFLSASYQTVFAIEREEETDTEVEEVKDISYEELELTSMDENGNIQPIQEDDNEESDEIEPDDSSLPDTMEPFSTTVTDGVVLFNNSPNYAYTVYNEVSTGRSGYTSKSYGADGAYIEHSTDGKKIRFMISGVIGEVAATDATVVSFSSVKSINHYKVNSAGRIIHYITSNTASADYASRLDVGPKQSYMETDVTYYSYDGHYFYKNYTTMLNDYRNNTRNNSINSNAPYYNYYQFLSHRTVTSFSADTLNKAMADLAVASEKAYGRTSNMKNLGSSFISNQNKYGVNALLMIGVAANESAWGCSSIAYNKNNLFGHAAYDSDPSGSSNSYSTPAFSIYVHAYEFLSGASANKGYFNPNDWRYAGSHLGDKSSGVNVQYASDPYWGEKAANVAWSIDKEYKGDSGRYTIGIKDYVSYSHNNLGVKSNSNSASTTLYNTGNLSNYAITILGTSATNGYYEIVSDVPLNNARTAIAGGTAYSYTRDYAYVPVTSYTKIVSVGSSSSNATYDSKIMLDAPTENSTIERGENLTIRGWEMSDYSGTRVQISLDNKVLTSSANRLARPDVLAAYPNSYGGSSKNPNPGYLYTFDTSIFSVGEHNIKIELLDNSGNIFNTYYMTIKITGIDSKQSLDYPLPDAFILSGEKVTIRGWEMSDIINAKIEISVDEKVLTTSPTRAARADVLAAYPNSYGGSSKNPMPGYSYTWDTKGLSTGNHTIKIKLQDGNGKTFDTFSSTITISKFDGKLRLDTPTANATFGKEDTLSVVGWALSNSAEDKIEIEIDGKVVTSNATRIARPDVLATYPDSYGGSSKNPSPGYAFSMNLKTYAEGKHTINVKLLDNQGKVFTSESRIIMVDNYQSKIYIDAPVENQAITMGNNMTIQGWEMSDCTDAKVQISVDGKIVTTNATRTKRADVLAEYPNSYGGSSKNPNPGYIYTMTTNGMAVGNHTIKIELVDASGNVFNTQTTVMQIKGYDSKIYIDAPVANQAITMGNNMTIQGWEMSDCTDAKVQISVDGKIVTTNATRTKRADVLAEYPNGYGGSSKNPNPGYIYTMTTNGMAVGNHTIKIELVDTSGNVFNTQTTVMQIKGYDSKIYIDAPVANQAITMGNNMTIQGWEMSDCTDAKVQISVDGKIVTTNATRTKRADVLAEYPNGYGGSSKNPNPGYIYTMTTNGMAVGNHTIKIELVDASGNVFNTQTTVMQIKGYDSTITIDSPTGNQSITKGTSLTIRGWELSDYIGTKVKITMNTTVLTSDATKLNREDVLVAYPNTCGGKSKNTLPGYIYTFSTSNLSKGIHTIKIELVDKNGNTFNSVTTKINII